MIKNDFIKITNLIKKELLENKVLKEAAIEEEKEGNLIDITSIIKQINYTQNKIIEKVGEYLKNLSNRDYQKFDGATEKVE